MEYSQIERDNASIISLYWHNGTLMDNRYGSPMEKESSKRVLRTSILRLLEERDMSQSKLAEMAGLQTGYLSELLDLESKKRWNNDTLDRVAKALDLPVSALFHPHTSITPTNVGRISVIGSVEAGVWREADEWAPGDGEILPIATDGFENCFALEIGGDSMNQFYADGDYVIVCPLQFYPHKLRSDEHVIVRRIKKDGSVEATVKELVVKDGIAELWPRSTNPKYKAPIDIHWPYEDPQKSGTELVEICGVVVTSYRVRRKL
jgi:SOS-response transcriptional repressor LexA